MVSYAARSVSERREEEIQRMKRFLFLIHQMKRFFLKIIQEMKKALFKIQQMKGLLF